MAWLDIENAVGEFEPVATRPSYQRRGLGKAVLLRGLRKMRERAMRTAIVQTNASNDAAIALYQSVGFRIVGRSAEYALDVAALSA
jgi:ribosomal protein S18 acetylase RimI-like enzyme